MAPTAEYLQTGTSRLDPESPLNRPRDLHLLEIRWEQLKGWYPNDNVVHVCGGQKVTREDTVSKGCLLYRFSSCRAMILGWAAKLEAQTVFMLRPDLLFFSVRAAPCRLCAPHTRYFESLLAGAAAVTRPRGQVYVRVRCGQHAALEDFPSPLCKPPRQERCPAGRYTIDDQMAVLSRSALPHYFQENYLASKAPSHPRRSCPVTQGWPEGRLTDTLYAWGVHMVPIKEQADLVAMLYRDASSLPPYANFQEFRASVFNQSYQVVKLEDTARADKEAAETADKMALSNRVQELVVRARDARTKEKHLPKKDLPEGATLHRRAAGAHEGAVLAGTTYKQGAPMAGLPTSRPLSALSRLPQLSIPPNPPTRVRREKPELRPHEARP